MRRLVSEQVTDAVHALAPQVPRAGRLALREGAVNALGARIERECFSILARQPRTSRQERRLLGTIIRIATTLERIGDAGTLMLERSAELSSTVQPCGASAVVQEMAANVLDMLSRAVVAFNTRNGELAATVRAGRPVVTGLGERLVRESLRAVRDGGEPPMNSAMRFVMIADHLEQIAGHAVGIAERVVNLVEGPPREPGRSTVPRGA
jgi:phosphate transport system protein